MTGLHQEPLSNEEKGWLEGALRKEQDGWVHLRIAGSPYVRGFQHGYLIADQFAPLIDRYRFMTLQSTGMEYEFFVDRAVQMHRSKIGAELTEEMEGIAAGLSKAGIAASLDDIIGWNAWLEVVEYWWPTAKGRHASHDRIDARSCRCSAFIATGDATKDGGIVIGHETFDDFWAGANLNLILEIWPDSGNGMLMQSAPCYISSMTDFFVTSGGLVGAETTIAGFVGYDEAGRPEYVRARDAMQYATDIDGFVERVNLDSNGAYANTWLIGNIATGEIAEYQQGHRYQNLSRKADGNFVGANFATDPRIRNLECKFTGYNDIRQQVGARRARWPQVIEPNFGKIDAEIGKAMLADHFDLYSGEEKACATTICAHYDEDPRYHMSAMESVECTPFAMMGSLDGKVCTTAMARNMSLHARFGRACGAPFVASEFLDRHPQFAWMDGYIEDRPTQPWSLFEGKRPE